MRLLRVAVLSGGLVLGLTAAAFAQGNGATTTGAAAGRGSTGGAVQVGVLTTTEVTTGESGPARQGNAGGAEAASGDRRQRVLGPVCAGLQDQPEVLAQCRAKSGM